MYCCVNYYFRLLLDSKTIGPFAAACCSKNVYSNIFNNVSLIFCILSNKINLFYSVLFLDEGPVVKLKIYLNLTYLNFKYELFIFSIFCVKNSLLLFSAQLANTIAVIVVYFVSLKSFYMFMMQNTLKILLYPFVPKFKLLRFNEIYVNKRNIQVRRYCLQFYNQMNKCNNSLQKFNTKKFDGNWIKN